MSKIREQIEAIQKAMDEKQGNAAKTKVLANCLMLASALDEGEKPTLADFEAMGPECMEICLRGLVVVCAQACG